ncbi:Na/Pi symporter [Bacillus litorisediminis]|uniref:Na/Pi symporter n=1 Tax=Bacillus litorisediminis TaxID=2922713 RepID=UPI001FAF09E6|nr:Na/Pi symporter [Bacillus litorisediminis]
MLFFLIFLICIGLFLFGMYLMRSGLFSFSGEKLNRWLFRFTNKPIKGMAASIIVTGLLQSSSAVMVITVGLVSAGALTFSQTIGIILGTNIGTTFTAEFMAFPIEQYTFPLLVLGAFIIGLARGKVRSIGFVLFGIGTIFTAMRGFKWISEPLSSISMVDKGFNLMNDSLIFALVLGMIFTACIHSSSATIGILMSFLASGTISLEASIAAMLGANIGTCITGWMASIGAKKEAKLTAYAHIWLNIIGVLLFFPFIKLLGEMASGWASSPAVQLAHSSVVFNIVSSLLVLPFAQRFGQLIEKIHGKRA